MKLPVVPVALFLLAGAGAGRAQPPVTITKDFEGGSLGQVERLGESTFRCHVEGQSDERGRNRQASWYYFRMDGVKGREVTLTLTDFVGEYNDKPGAVPTNIALPWPMLRRLLPRLSRLTRISIQ